MKTDNWTLCYFAIQRLYRNCVTAFLRQRLSEAFPGEWQARLRAAFKKEWEHIVSNSQSTRATGELTAPIADDADYLSVSHFYNIFDIYFDVLFPALPVVTKEERGQIKGAILRWSKTVKDLRNPMSHPPESDLSPLDALAMVDAARRVAGHIDANVSRQIQQIESELMQGGLAPHTGKPPLDDSLPPAESIVVKFAERESELKDLWTWFESPTSRRWVLHGAGGKGKTALAYHFAVQVKRAAPEPFSAVWWLSAKKRRFLEGTIVPVHEPDFSDLQKAIDKLLFDYGWVEHIETPLGDKTKVLLRLLEDLPALVVVDDVDSLEGQDELAVEFFTLDVPTTRSKVLLTSRRRLTGLGATATEIRGFTGEEGYRFLASRVKLFGLDPNGFTKATADKVLAATEGSPMYIDDLLRYCASGRPINEVIELWLRETGDSAREYALRREFDMLSPEAKTVLLACSVWQGSCTYDDIRALANLSETRTDKAVDELQRLFLVPRPETIAGLPRFDVNPSVRSLVTKLMNSTSTFRKVEAARKALSGELPTLRGRVPKVAAAAREAVSLVKLGSQERAESVLRAMLEEYPEDPDLLGQLGWVYQRWKPEPRWADARDRFSRAAQLRCRRQDLYWHWWTLECDQQEWSVAARAAQMGLKIFQGNSRLLYCEGYARSRLGRSLRLSFSPERAWAEHGKAQELLEGAISPVEDLVRGEYQFHGAVLRWKV